MKDKKPLPDSTDDFGNLQFENEFLKLKLQAEFGAVQFSSPSTPPEVENFFLKNVFAVEKAFEERRTIKVFEKIGSPGYRTACSLTAKELCEEFMRLDSLLKQHAIILSFSGNYSMLEKYQFLTTEFFDLEVQDIDIPNFMMFFQYEEFRPNDD